MKIGLALGGGGAKGLAHIPLLEVFDECGMRPAAMAGTSIGAIVGSLYAAGHSGKEIRAFIDEKIPQEDESGSTIVRKLFDSVCQCRPISGRNQNSVHTVGNSLAYSGHVRSD